MRKYLPSSGIKQRKGKHVITVPTRAAIYVGTSLFSSSYASRNRARSVETCQRFCAMQNYQLSEQHIYQGGQEPFWSNTPVLIQLRVAALQRQFDVLVITSLASIGYIAPWEMDQSLRTINGVYIPPESSMKASQRITSFYNHQVRIESVTERYGTFDVEKQMLSDALQFMRAIRDSRTQ